MGETFLATDSFHHADVTHSFAPSPFLSETKHQQQQQGVCIFLAVSSPTRRAGWPRRPSCQALASVLKHRRPLLSACRPQLRQASTKHCRRPAQQPAAVSWINRVLAHHIQHSTFATCVHYLRQAAEADQVGQGRVHCICCRKTNSCRFGHGCRFDG